MLTVLNLRDSVEGGHVDCVEGGHVDCVEPARQC